MIHIVTGGSGSGKSAYAEDFVCKLSAKYGNCQLYYVATMYPYDSECEKRILRHREMRKQKNFTTIECYKNIGDIKSKLSYLSPESLENIVLLECMSNLLANELYMNINESENIKAENNEISEKKLSENNERTTIKKTVEDRIVESIIELNQYVKDLVIVTNEIFSDGKRYDEATEEYIEKLGYINCELAKKANSVVEVVYSIPIYVKGDFKL